MRKSGRFVRWLYPGLGVKRWLLLFAVAVIVLALGLGLLLGGSATALYRGLGRLMPQVVSGPALMAAGVVLAIVSLRRLVLSIVGTVAPEAHGALGEALFLRRHLGRGPSICALGGGTGLAVLLRGIKQYTSNVTAVVTVSDDGGSSGRLRGELGIQPPGDVRNCLAALADTEPLMERVFQHRFDRGSLAGHTVGNVLLGGLAELSGGDLVAAIKAASRVLAVRGRVLPATTERVGLRADMADGRAIRGETEIVAARGRIRRLHLEPEGAPALPEAVTAILEADLVVVGPGSLYTSVLPHLLIDDVRDALRRTAAYRVYVANVMTQPGETDGFDAADHLTVLMEHAGSGLFDAVLCHTGPLAPARLDPYRRQGSEPVAVDRTRIEELGVRLITGDVVARDRLVRHDPQGLARALVGLFLEHVGIPSGPGRLVDYLLVYDRAQRGADEAAAPVLPERGQPPG